MKKQKKILSFIACLSLLSSCNKNTPTSNSCSVTTSTSTTTPDEKPFNILDHLNFNLIEKSLDNLIKDSYDFVGFDSTITEQQKLSVTEFRFPEEYNSKPITTLSAGNYFEGFSNLKRIILPKTIKTIRTSSNSTIYSNLFCFLPALEEIVLEEGNEILEIKEGSNCLIKRNYTINSDGTRNYTDDYIFVTAWKECVIPNEIKSIEGKAFLNNQSVTSIKLNKDLTLKIGDNTLRGIQNLTNVDVGENTNYIVEGNCLIDKTDRYIYTAWGDVTIPKAGNTYKQINLSDCYSVTSVDIPDDCGYTSTAGSSFANTQIKEIHFSSTIETIAPLTRNKNLTKVTVSENNLKYGCEGNCIYLKETNIAFTGCGDVIIPEGIQTIEKQGFNNNYITSIHFPSTLNSMNTSFRECSDLKKITISENNKNFEVKNNCLIQIDKSTNDKIVILALSNENGDVILPDDATVYYTNSLGQVGPNENAKSIKFNDGLKEIRLIGDNTPLFSVRNKFITEIELPLSIEKIGFSDDEGKIISATGITAFSYLTCLTKLSFTGNRTSNNYYKIDGNCLIKKGSKDDYSDGKIIFGYGDVIIPEYITELPDYLFSFNYSITSLTLHKNIAKVGASTFKNIRYDISGLFDTINFLGTLEEFERKIDTGDSSDYKKSLRELLNNEHNQQVTVNYLDKDGTPTSALIGEMK